MSELGKVHVITGPGKGKTTAAFGLAMRAAGHGLHVCIVQFMKSGGITGEVLAAKRLKTIEVAQFGSGKFVDSKEVTAKDKTCADDAIQFIRKRLVKGGCDLLILDEINIAVSFGLVDAREVLNLLSSRGPGVEVVLTGRNAPMEFIEAADYVTVMESRKHPMESGMGPRKGIEW